MSSSAHERKAWQGGAGGVKPDSARKVPPSSVGYEPPVGQPSWIACSPAMVALLSWLVPGAGYWAIGQRARGLTVGITIVMLFLLGILIGGIRVMDPPGWGMNGYMVLMVGSRVDQQGQYLRRYEPFNPRPALDTGEHVVGTALMLQPISELAEKPWFAPQILCGPLTLASNALSVFEARPSEGPDGTVSDGVPMSHARLFEIGTLYTAVAGMLNLLIIIDAAYRAAQNRKEAHAASYL